MDLSFAFFINSILLGVGLAMDAFSVSLANGLSEPCMPKKRACLISGIFSGFQFLMPLIGWVFVSTFVHAFSAFEKFIPYIALVLLCFIGSKMLIEGVKSNGECKPATNFVGLLVQGIATSIDALSVGFTIASYNVYEALLACGIIGLITFFICLLGVMIGKKAGSKLAGKAGILGGVILIIIGLEIFITGIL